MWEQVTAAIVALVVGLIAASTPLLRKRLAEFLDADAKKIKLVTKGFEAIAELYVIFSKIQEIPAVDRVLIFVGHNCGGLPRPDEPYWVRAVHGISAHDDKDPLDLYGFDLQVDSSYVEMLLKIVKEGKFEFHTEEQKGTKLAKLYATEGVRHSILYRLQVHEEKILYLSVAKYTENYFTENEITQIEHWVDRLRAFLREQR